MEELKTVKELADIYGVTLQTVYDWVDQGLEHTYTKRGLRIAVAFDLNKVADWIEEQKARGRKKDREPIRPKKGE